MKYKVLMLKNLADSGKKYLRDYDCEVLVSSSGTEEEYIKELSNIDALFVRNEPITAKMMDSAPKLKVIAKHGIGYDNIDIEAATKRNIQVVYAPMGNVNSVAEHTLMMILACAKRYGVVNSEIKKGNYNIRFILNDANDVEGKTIGLIGCGNIARVMAKKAINGFGMKVIAYDPFIQPGITQEGIDVICSKDEVLKNSDYISIHIPVTKETKRSIGMDEFRKMKKSAYIINTSRGEIIRESELIEALKDGIIHGAGLDVYEEEPVAKSNELLTMDNVIATAHTAGMTIEASHRLSLAGAQGIIEVLYNKPLTWPVNDLR